MCQPNKQNVSFYFDVSSFCSFREFRWIISIDNFFFYFSQSQNVRKCSFSSRSCKSIFKCILYLYALLNMHWILLIWHTIQFGCHCCCGFFENRLLNKLLVCQNKSISFTISIQFSQVNNHFSPFQLFH